MRNKFLLFFVAAAFVFAAAGCGEKAPSFETEAGAASTRVITDLTGRAVAIPDRAERVVTPFMMYARIVVALGAVDRLAGISHTCVLPEEERPFGRDLLALPDVGDFGENIELIASLKPDLIFAYPQNIRALEKKTGVAVVGASLPQGGGMEELFASQITLIGSALGMEKEASELNSFIAKKLSMVTDVTSGIPESRRPKVYFAWTSWTGDITNTVVDFDPIELAGGINVAKGCGNFAKGQRGILVSREHIIKWDPDVIFLSRYKSDKLQNIGAVGKAAPVTIDDVLNDPLLKDVSAVKNRRVYYTTAFCNWWPHQRAIAQTFQMAKIFHPELFKGLDVEKEGNEVFKRFYGGEGLYAALVADLELYTGE